ncbi:hypothetical protein [Telluribacter sp. SYSU D00476]|uniref:hypothetical protein n=1 Tax=Telluribacter sp. SYSU D00476 TaxID=2811430 RepID=UPI001FF3DFD9|nr:hypothetical protein [Telluribacter sp. SYSU D00476]
MLNLCRTDNGKIVGSCEINGQLIVSKPHSELPDVLDEVLYMAAFTDQPLLPEPVFDVVWLNEEEEIKCSGCQHILPLNHLKECRTCGKYLCSICSCTQCHSLTSTYRAINR